MAPVDKPAPPLAPRVASLIGANMEPKQQPALKRSILDRNFKYVPAAETDVRKTFAKALKEMRRELVLATDNGKGTV